VLGWDPLALSEEQIHQTRYTQPALFTVSALLSDYLYAQDQTPGCTAGHSLGEYSALYAAGVFDFETGLRLVSLRGQLMERAGDPPGSMAAVIGFDRTKLEHLCQRIPNVTIANDNSPEQLVISGSVEGVQAVCEQLQAKRTVPLKVSGAFHSPFMQAAAEEFAHRLREVEFQTPRVPVYSNCTATASRDPQALKQALLAQMTAPVRWRETVLQMAADGVQEVWEIGPGNVLTGLVRRTAPSLRRRNISSLQRLPSGQLEPTALGIEAATSVLCVVEGDLGATMAGNSIRFGTDGWRAVIAEGFTFQNLALAAQASAQVLARTYPGEGILIGYDNRFLSERFAAHAAEVVARLGIPVYLSACAAPTPAFSWGAKEQGCHGALVITASHNPPHYSGLKVKGGFGGSVPPEVTAAIERELSSLQPLGSTRAPSSHLGSLARLPGSA
jgi:[acyl-carrier-protein] S-malonyltransferase